MHNRAPTAPPSGSRLNELLQTLDAAALKPVLTALVLPPVPLLALAFMALVVARSRRALGLVLGLLAIAGLWLTGTVALGEGLQRALFAPSPLPATELARIKRDVAAGRPVAVLVLGGGREPHAPEYDAPNLPPLALERLRYGAWLARATGAPLAYAGGVGHAQRDTDGVSEADAAARIASTQFGVPLRWREGESRDTRGNAAHAVAMLRAGGVREVLLVTHGWHMPRSLRAFDDAVRRSGAPMQVTPASMGLAPRTMLPLLRWMPSEEGFALTRRVLREQLGLWMGA
jgi:uncharacterized SAM-binding protein YcdF (DUF218 family)